MSSTDGSAAGRGEARVKTEVQEGPRSIDIVGARRAQLPCPTSYADKVF